MSQWVQVGHVARLVVAVEGYWVSWAPVGEEHPYGGPKSWWSQSWQRREGGCWYELHMEEAGACWEEDLTPFCWNPESYLQEHLQVLLFYWSCPFQTLSSLVV